MLHANYPLSWHRRYADWLPPPNPRPVWWGEGGGGGRAEVGGSPLLGGGELLVLNITYYQDGF